jgi:hypothetical protein
MGIHQLTNSNPHSDTPFLIHFNTNPATNQRRINPQTCSSPGAGTPDKWYIIVVKAYNIPVRTVPKKFACCPSEQDYREKEHDQ